ncbi:hypothetical protein [Nonomuraea jiangxiensis]|uniref:hypothetical protein n=1 Tax=Nonomuraea jiangxiensis TaxID=633440 RepID=UPI00115FB96D|nr:hypothetical protein [Nonomuraea jiangxiensis]
MTDHKPAAHLRPARIEQVAAGLGTGRDTTGGAAPRRAGAATGVGTAGAKPSAAHTRETRPEGAQGTEPAGTHARINPAAELGFSGDPGQHGDPGDVMLHAQVTWDGTLATNRLDELGVTYERRRLEVKDVTTSVSLLVDGWPADVEKCVQSLLDHTSARVLALDLGNVDGAGDVLRGLAERYPERVAVWHVAEQPHWRGGTATWGECRAKLLRLDEAEVHVLMETSLMLCGDALTPLVAAVVEGAVAAGWRGVELLDGGEQWQDAAPGRVNALTGDLMAVRRSAAIGALPEQANYGRNADLELSLGLSGELVVPAERLPVQRLGPHDIAPDYGRREGQRNYDAVLRMLRTG